MRRPFGLVIVFASSVALPLSAQATVAGMWFTEFDAQTRIVNGSVSTVKGHARIELQVAGDSIHGTWQNLNAAGAADGPARPLGGALTSGGAHFEALTPSEIVRREMDSETHTKVVMNYDVAVHGDSLVGTEHWVAADHASQGEPRRFTATRKS
ncbi:MAG TPA: hypothetical protein VKB45_05520 [Gemmatimonadales bacterium]|nr:hypothetical protein [Gemmatimonadales bacterium]